MSVQPYGRKGQSIYSIDRRKLNELLLTNAEGKRGISVHFKYKKTWAFQVGQENFQEKIVKTDFIFGCDGVYSTVKWCDGEGSTIAKSI